MNFLNLKAVLSLNGSGFALGLKRAESASKQFSKEIKGQFAQAFGTAAVVAYGAKLINMADNITDLSERLDVSTKALQEWNYAAQKSGSSIERVTQFLEHLSRVREAALGGDANAMANLNSFGITDFSSGVDQMGRRVGKKVASGDFSRRALQEIGGKGVGELIPALRAMDELSEAAHRAGRVLSDETLESLKALKNEAMGLADVFMGPMSKALIFIGQKLSDAALLTKAIVAGGAAFLGAMPNVKMSDVARSAGARFAGNKSGGVASSGSLKEAMDEVGKAFDAVLDEWEAKKKAIQNQAANRANVGGGESGGILHKISIPQMAGERAAQSALQMNRPNLTAWQSAGAAIRFSPEKRVLEDIAKNTRDTANNTRPSSKSTVGANGLGAELS